MNHSIQFLINRGVAGRGTTHIPISIQQQQQQKQKQKKRWKPADDSCDTTADNFDPKVNRTTSVSLSTWKSCFEFAKRSQTLTESCS